MQELNNELNHDDYEQLILILNFALKNEANALNAALTTYGPLAVKLNALRKAKAEKDDKQAQPAKVEEHADVEEQIG